VGGIGIGIEIGKGKRFTSLARMIITSLQLEGLEGDWILCACEIPVGTVKLVDYSPC